MTFVIAGGIEWEKDETNKVLTIRPAASPESGYTSGQMINYTSSSAPPWGKITASDWTLALEYGIINIGDFAFRSSRFIGSLTIPDTVTNIGRYSFAYCFAFTGPLSLGIGVTTIEESAFSGCYGITGTVIIPASVRTIGNNAFYNSYGLSKIEFLGDQPAIGTDSFILKTASPETTYDVESNGWADLTTFPEYTYTKWNFISPPWNIDGGIEWYKDETNKVLKIRPTSTPESGYTSGQMKDYTSTPPWGEIEETGWTLTLEDGITNIGNRAFMGCHGFTGSLIIPSSVTIIGNFTFQNCCGFTGSLIIPDNVTSIGNSAFVSCAFIESLTIGSSVTTIGYLAFNQCINLTGSLIIPSSVTAIKGYAFSSCYSLSEVRFLGNQPTLANNSMELDTRTGSTQVYDCYSPGNWAETAMTSTVSGATIWNFHSLPTSKTISIKVDGTWKQGTPYVNVGGTWKQGTPYVNVGGVWK